MEQQLKLWQYQKRLFGKSTIKLQANNTYLEHEKEKFIQNMSDFADVCWRL